MPSAQYCVKHSETGTYKHTYLQLIGTARIFKRRSLVQQLTEISQRGALSQV